MLSRRGARVVHGPTMSTTLLDDLDATIAATEAVLAAPVDVVVLTTGIGVRSWFGAAESVGMGDELQARPRGRPRRRPRAEGAVGRSRRRVWRWRGRRRPRPTPRCSPGSPPTASPAAASSCSATAARRCSPTPSPRCAPRGRRRARVPLEHARGRDAGDPAARRGHRPPARRRHVHVLLRGAQRVRARPRPRGLAAAFDEEVLAVAVGPVTADALREAGVTRVVEPVRARLGSMVHALAGCLEERASVLRHGAAEVRWQGLALFDPTAPRSS